jgi:hypothetical protein
MLKPYLIFRSYPRKRKVKDLVEGGEGMGTYTAELMNTHFYIEVPDQTAVGRNILMSGFGKIMNLIRLIIPDRYRT